jgi:NADPH2:quinone reductase
LSDEACAVLSVTYGTGLHALKDRANLKPGETLAVLGAAGGAGQAAIEIGKAMGARVIACASSRNKLDFCRSVGADMGVDYSLDDLKGALKGLTGSSGVDVIYDPVGGALSEQATRAIAWGGRHLVVGFAAGEIPKLPLNLVLLKSSALVGVFWGEHVGREPARHKANMALLRTWAEEGRLNPHIHARYGFEDAASAFAAISGRSVKGKVVLVP